MEIKNLEITRNDFEEAIPVATTKNDSVFDLVAPFIESGILHVADDVLGAAGVNAVSSGGGGQLVRLVKRLVCLDVFLPHFRSLDLVLTATGFGVVSTQDLTPASKARVDALKSQLDIEQKRAECRVLRELFLVDGWSSQVQRKRCVPNLFFDFSYLGSYAGVESPTMNDWRRVQPQVLEADGFLRSKLGDGQMEVFLGKLTSHGLCPVEEEACLRMLRFMGLHIGGHARSAKACFRSLMNYIESHLDVFTAYGDSDVWKTNHFKGYENTKESGMFLFQG